MPPGRLEVVACRAGMRWSGAYFPSCEPKMPPATLELFPLPPAMPSSRPRDCGSGGAPNRPPGTEEAVVRPPLPMCFICPLRFICVRMYVGC